MGIRVKCETPSTTVVIKVPDSTINRINTLIPAYATTLPDELADLMWQIYRAIKDKASS